VYWITITAIIGSVLLVDLIIRLCFARVIIRAFESKLPQKAESYPAPRQVGAPQEGPLLPFNADAFQPAFVACDVEFPTKDGLTLRGSLYGMSGETPLGLIIFCPESDGSRFSASAFCHGLLAAGYYVLSIDFRNHGDSDSLEGYEPLHWATDHELVDLEAALEFVAGRDDLRELPLGLMGISRGGSTALATAARHPEIQAVAVEGAFTTASMHFYWTNRWATWYSPRWFQNLIPVWHVESTLRLCRYISQWRRHCHYTNLERLLPKLCNRPVLLIAGGHDSCVPFEVTQSIANRIGGEQCEVWQVPRAKHNQARQVDPATYDARVVNFFRHHLSLPDELPSQQALPQERPKRERDSAVEPEQHHQPTAP